MKNFYSHFRYYQDETSFKTSKNFVCIASLNCIHHSAESGNMASNVRNRTERHVECRTSSARPASFEHATFLNTGIDTVK